ncbi:MAG: hypothetical protein KAS49_04925, partial [Candidatus Cloacimonetes bacterium]|nr:hypothetical protein [Candidatus Cloacimonadota bacterium]
MKNYYQIIIITMFFVISNLFANDVKTIYNDLENLTALNEKVAEVNDFSFSRDVANFHLKNGKLYILSPVNNRSIAMIFKGEGSVNIAPPTKISQERLYSEFQVNSFNSSFSFLFMVFTDSTLVEFSRKLDFVDSIKDHKLEFDIEDCMNYLYDHKGNDYDPSLLQTILNNEQNGYFYGHLFNKKKSKPFFFEYNPNQTEEVSLAIRAKRQADFGHSRKIICMFHRQEDYLSGKDLSFEDKDIIKVEKYTIDATITKKMDFSATCTLDFQSSIDSGKWLNLILLNKLRIKSITNIAGDSLNFFKEDESSILWVELSEKLTKGKAYKIIINYNGDLIYQGGNIVKIHSFDFWYPQYPTYNFKHFDLTFHYPSNYDLVSVGKKLSEEKIKKVKTAHWITKYPVNLAPFNMGKFKNDEFINPSIPVLSLHLNNNLKNAKADVANSIAFYQNVYGKCKFDSLTVAEIPHFLSGEAYPGLINFFSDDYITDAIYKVYADIYINETDFAQLRAHEVAHQWWGCGVGSRSYHDKWLFEGLAEFSSIWFIQTSLNDTNKYFEFLSRWRTKIVNEHNLINNRGESECPLWLGSRAPYYINYFKGGWVFHMLRNLMIDLKTFDESSFKTMMQDFYSTYKNSTATTEDFKKIVEKHIKTDMTWFFDQWIYGNEIPKYKFDYEIVKKDDGKYYAKCNIEQKNVSENFKSYIP